MKFDYFDGSDSVQVQLDMLEKELSENPESVPLTKRFVKLLLEYQNPHRLELAKSNMGILLHKNPDIESKVLYVRTLRLVHDSEQATQMVSKFLETNPENPDLLEEHGRILLGKGYDKEAEKIFQKALKIVPYNQRLLRAMIQLLGSQKKYPEMLSFSTYLLKLESSDKNIKLRADALRCNNKTKDAIKLLEDFRQKSPEIFDNLMSSADGTNVSLPVTLVNLYFHEAIEIASKKNLKFRYDFEKNHTLNFLIDTDDKVDELLIKADELFDKIIFDENFLPTSSSEDILSDKALTLFYQRKFRECRYFLVKEKMTEIPLYAKVLFYLKEFDKSLDVYSRILDEYPSATIYQKRISECFRAMGKIEEYQKHYALYEKLKKEKSIKEKDKPSIDQNYDFSNLTDKPFDNLTKNVNFYKNRTSAVLKIWDKFFSMANIVFLHKYLNFEMIHEIQVIRGIQPYNGGLDFFEKLDPLIDFTERFNLHHKDKCKISVRLISMKTAHDRYLIEEGHVYDIMTIDQITNNQTGENHEVKDVEGIQNRRDEFERLWDDDEAIEIKQNSRRNILRKLAEVLENSTSETLSDKIVYEINPSKKHHKQNKAIRDKVPDLIKKVLWKECSITKIEDDNDFINKMQDKIHEELDEYINAADRIDNIKENEQKIEKHNKWISDYSSEKYEKLANSKKKKIKKLEDEIKILKKQIETETHVNPLEELSDILEAVYRIAELRGSSAEELDAIRDKRAEKYGRFSKNVYLLHNNDSSQT